MMERFEAAFGSGLGSAILGACLITGSHYTNAELQLAVIGAASLCAGLIRFDIANLPLTVLEMHDTPKDDDDGVAK